VTTVTEPVAGLSWPALTNQLLDGQDLSAAETEAAMTAIMEGSASAVQIAGFLVALRAKGETGREFAGKVRTMRRFPVAVPVTAPNVDTSGTGGGRSGTFIISTVAAIVAAGAGARGGKHGNRAASGRCGSADLLESCVVKISLPPVSVASCIDEVGIGFFFAPGYHPAMRHVMPARRELAIPTVFNVLGPLTNPAGAAHQTIGVSSATMAPRMAEVLAALDTVHALVFHGADGLDELTTTGVSHVWEIRDGQVDEYDFDPTDIGLARAYPDDLVGGDVPTNRAMADAVLDGQPGPTRDIVLLGAAAALYAADLVDDLRTGVEAAGTVIDTGVARLLLARWIELSQELAQELSA
jgi:anthranilate phosphoribosyltransferase